VGSPGYESYDVGACARALRREGALLADAAERAGMGAEVPACPGWRVRDLLKHLGYVHRWAAGYLTEGFTQAVGEPSEQVILGQGPDLYLLLWNRRPAEMPQVTGDPGILAAFGQALNIIWH
jgi:Mycothiol maleylpyruvate isomerase N-terminal domain